ncbi:MAG: hypothetical protein ABSA23_03660 [Anaerolineales bacterium]
MADVRCPMCGKPNPEKLEECQFCGAPLNPVNAPPSENSQAIKPGEEPVKRNTSEFEKINLSRGAPIRPGEAPTYKNTADLERALPSWLRTLREGKSPAAGEIMAEPSAQESSPAVPQPAPAPGPSEDLPDWLSGPSKAVPEDEEVPDWLADLRSGKSAESARSEPPAVAKAPATEQPESGISPELFAADDSPDWLKNLQSPSTGSQEPSASETSPQPGGVDDSPDWLKTLQSPSSAAQEPPAPLQGGDNLPDWLSDLPGISAQSSSTPIETGEPAQTENIPDWLGQLNQKSIPQESATPAGPAGSVPDWLSNFDSAAPPSTSAFSENFPDRLPNLEGKSTPDSGTPAKGFNSESQSPSNPPQDTPNWLSQLQADVNAAQDAQQHKDDFEVVPAAPASPKETGPLPDWLIGIESTTPLTSSTPPLIVDNKDNLPGEQGETAFLLETPNWLSKLNPEQASEKSTITAANEEPANSKTLESAELPSWVQAMRPVESVVESKTAALIENQVGEQNGPLAGLSGVLPSEPGLGFLRKPPAYSTKLQVSDGQRNYAATLERLIAGETTARTPKTTPLSSNQLLRWLITVLLFLAVVLPFIFGANKGGAQIAPATSLGSSDQGASSKIINGLAGNIPALVVFDYDPALSGELEAVAAPLMDRLLSKGVPLALISTSPTGPILAEHFLQTTPLVKDYQYQSGNQYVNLGYLAGGPVGILYFANSPTEAVTVGMDGQPVWVAGPLQAIQKLSDFAVVIVLTDNADTGRNWIEQAGPRLGSTPMLMVISAQAEPMIRPYFDSGQLKGLVSGLSDAKIYEQSNQSLGPTHQFGLDNQYWDSFSVGMLVAELIIVAGGIMGVMIDWRARHKVSGEEA